MLLTPSFTRCLGVLPMEASPSVGQKQTFVVISEIPLGTLLFEGCANEVVKHIHQALPIHEMTFTLGRENVALSMKLLVEVLDG